jgi:transcription elongation factor GreA
MKRIPMTPEGYRKLSEELKRYREVLRPENIRAIEEARAHGDLSENAEYDSAKDRQAHIEAQIRDMEGKLSMAEVIDIRKIDPSDRVVFGTTVHVRDSSTDEEFVYRIVGAEEADARKGLLSHSSPIGKALLGRSEGDEVRVVTPAGVREFEILQVEYC